MVEMNYPEFGGDVFAVIKIGEEDEILNVLNSQFPTINFTCECETNDQLPFLDVLVTRINDGLDFSVYRKPTNISRYIPADSFSPMSHKRAAFNSMVHRLCMLPLNLPNYIKELHYIKYAAHLNGYDERLIDALVKRHSTFIDEKKHDDITHYIHSGTECQ